MKAPKQSLLLGICLLWHCLPVLSQNTSSLCPNTALLPVFKQDFGQGVLSSTTSAAPAGSTNYIFGGVGTDGNYIITPLVNNANKADWTKGGDHTGNTNGNMFLVNAGGGNSIFFKQTVTGLCSGSSFNFSAWLANVNTANTQGVCGASLVYPDVIFNIKNLSGTVLGTFTTGNLPLSPNNGPPNWLQYGFQFTLPVGTTSLILEMVDLHGGAAACGNDLALDDIVFSECTPNVTVSLTTAAAICSGTNTSITSSLVNSPFITPAYQWQKSTDNGLTWNNIGAASTSANNLSLNNVVVSDGGLYRVLAGPDISSLSSLSCITASNSISITVNPTPVLTVGSNTPICSGNNLTLTSNISSGTTLFNYSWTGPNSFSSSLANPVIAAAVTGATGTYVLNLIDAKGCTASSNTGAVVNPTPLLTVTNGAATICSGSNTNIQFNSSLGGSLYFWDASAVSGTASGYYSNFVGFPMNTINDVIDNVSSTTATIRYKITVSVATGCSATDSTDVTIYPKPTTSFAGNDQILCNSSVVTLNGNAPLVVAGVWSFLSGPSGVSFANTALPNTIASGLTYGTYQFIWTIANGICTDSKDTVSVTVLPLVTLANAGVDQVLCNTTSAILNANTPTSGTGVWAFLSGPSTVSFVNALSPVTVVNGLTNGTYQFTWSIANGVCADSKDTVSITINPTTLPGLLSANATVCAGTNNGTLSLSGFTGNIIQWEASVNNGVSWSVIANTNSNYSYTNLLTTALYRVLVQSGSCTSQYSNIVTVAVNPITIPGLLAADATVCAGINNGTLSLSGSTGNIIRWEISVNNGVSWSVIVNTNNTYAYNNLSAATLYRVLVQSGICSSQYSNISTITVLPTVSIANAGADQMLCNVGNVLLNANLPTSGNGAWSFLSGPAAVSFTNTALPNTSVNGLITGAYQFIWTIANNICAASKDTISITVNPATVAGFLAADATVCSGINNGTLSLSGFTGNIIQWEISVNNGASWSVIADTNSTYSYNNLLATSLYKVLVQSGNCPS